MSRRFLLGVVASFALVGGAQAQTILTAETASPNSTPGGLARRPLARPSTPKRTDHQTICVEVMSVHEVHTVEIHTSQPARELLARVVAKRRCQCSMHAATVGRFKVQ